MSFVFSPASTALLAQLNPDVRSVALLAITRTPFDWRIVQTARTVEQQRQYFRAGNSKVNPDAYDTPAKLYAAAKHIVGPGMPLSRAMDVAIVGADPYHIPTLAYLAGVMNACAAELEVLIRWGGDFDRDGRLLEKGTFHDLPHFELGASR